MQILQCQPSLFQVQQTLSKNSYFSRSPLPGFADGVIYKLLSQNKSISLWLQKEIPDKKIYPNFYHWYIVMKQFAESAFEGWIREKRYIDNQSEKCLMLIADVFAKQDRKVLNASNRKKSLDTSQKSLNPEKSSMESTKLKPIDMNNASLSIQKAQYSMVVQLKQVDNIEELFKRFYKLKYFFIKSKRIKLKELNLHNKKQKSIFLRFLADRKNIGDVKEEIQHWVEVKHVVYKESRGFIESADKKKLQRAVSIR